MHVSSRVGDQQDRSGDVTGRRERLNLEKKEWMGATLTHAALAVPRAILFLTHVINT